MSNFIILTNHEYLKLIAARLLLDFDKNVFFNYIEKMSVAALSEADGGAATMSRLIDQKIN